MFEKLLSLLLQAKSGAVATVFVLGTTGALVTATVDAGVTTITITQPSSTTAGSETTTPDGTTTNTTVTDTILALFNRTSAEDGTTEPATGGNGCSDAAHERNEQMKRVNDASKDAREDVRALGKDAGRSADAKELVKDADTEIKDLRQAAVKDIHGTFDCDKDADEASTGTSDGTTSTTTTTVALNSDDAEAIADEAIEAMEKVVEDLEAALEGLEDDADSSEESTTNEKQNGKSDDAKDKAKNENKGKSQDKGNGKGRN